MEEKEIEVNGEKIKIALKLPKEQIESNSLSLLLDDTVNLDDVVKAVQGEVKKDDKE